MLDLQNMWWSYSRTGNVIDTFTTELTNCTSAARKLSFDYFSIVKTILVVVGWWTTFRWWTWGLWREVLGVCYWKSPTTSNSVGRRWGFFCSGQWNLDAGTSRHWIPIKELLEWFLACRKMAELFLCRLRSASNGIWKLAAAIGEVWPPRLEKRKCKINIFVTASVNPPCTLLVGLHEHFIGSIMSKTDAVIVKPELRKNA